MLIVLPEDGSAGPKHVGEGNKLVCAEFIFCIGF
jgi:hypothetical protein